MPNHKSNRLVRAVTGLVLICALWLIGIPAALGFKLIPISMDFEPSGRGANQAFRVENESDEPVAVQISILARTMTIDGKEVNTPDDTNFIVYPTQILLKPKQVQNVRVKWIGTPKPEKELSYRILAEQLPVNLKKEQSSGSQINIVVRYLGSIYIVPKGAKPNVVLESAAAGDMQDGKRQLALTFNNRGDLHSIMRNLSVTLHSGGKAIELGPEQLNGINGENVLARSQRRFLMDWPAGLPEGPVEASIKYSQKN